MAELGKYDVRVRVAVEATVRVDALDGEDAKAVLGAMLSRGPLGLVLNGARIVDVDVDAVDVTATGG